MRKAWLYALLLAAALLLPKDDVELGKMKPVETVSVRIQDGNVVIETDTEDIGTGNTMQEALNNLRDTTAGRIYLDTADFLLVSAEATNQIPALYKYLKGNVRLCERKGDVDVKKAGEYLRVHTPAVRLKNWKPNVSLQVLECENERLKIK